VKTIRKKAISALKKTTPPADFCSLDLFYLLALKTVSRPDRSESFDIPTRNIKTLTFDCLKLHSTHRLNVTFGRTNSESALATAAILG
jgi:hypothetical protein